MLSPLATLETLAQSPSLSDIRQWIDPERVLADTIAIQQIPAPTFEEARRAAFLADRFAALGLEDVRTDAIHNVFGRRRGIYRGAPALLVSAHTDTVFAQSTDLTVRRDDARVYGPGIGDNSLGVASLLALLGALGSADIHTGSDIWFVANSREEGLGDLGGMRAVWAELGAQLGAAVVVEGMALGRIYHAGIAVRRLRVSCRAPGGHSWHHFGQPSAIHSLVRLAGQILTIEPSRDPRTTYNIGLLEGGQSVNSLASSASMVLDLRSETHAGLAVVETQVRDAVGRLQEPMLAFQIEVVGDRPAGRISRDHVLAQLAAAAVRTIHRAPVFESGSTDANALLAQGLPTVTIGISRGGHAHRLDEFIDTAPIVEGILQLALLVLAAADTLASWAAGP